MPSTVAVLTGLTYKGTDLQDFPRVFLQIAEGGPGSSPETRGENSRTPYLDGQRYGPRRADRLAVTLIGWVSGEGDTEATARADTATARAELAALFDVTAGEGALVVTTEDGTSWTLNAYPEAFIPEWLPPVPTHQTITVRLLAVDPPYWTGPGS